MAAALRLGVVGCGAIAVHVHLRNARKLPGLDVVALADPSRDALARAARVAPRAAKCTGVDELLSLREVDAVLVASPSFSHAEAAVATLESGRHLYLEKPIAATVSEGERVVATAERAGVVAVTGFNRRFHPLLVEAAHVLARGAVGPPVRVRTLFAEPVDEDRMPTWKRRRATGGGAPLDLGSHHLDTLRWLLRAEPRAVAADIRSVRSEHDDATLVYRFGDCEATIECSFVRPRCDEVELEDDAGHTLRVSRYEGAVLVNGRPSRSRRTVPARCRVLLGRAGDVSYRPALAAFAARARGADTRPATLEDGLASLRAIVAAEAIAG